MLLESSPVSQALVDEGFPQVLTSRIGQQLTCHGTVAIVLAFCTEDQFLATVEQGIQAFSKGLFFIRSHRDVANSTIFLDGTAQAKIQL